jgi:ribosomal protein S14
MLFKQVKDLKIRRLYKNFENKYNIKKFVLVNLLNRLIVKKFSKNIRKRTIFLLSKSKIRLVSKVKIVRRCVMTNRGRQVLRNYNLSHAIFRNLNTLGVIPGCKKAIW